MKHLSRDKLGNLRVLLNNGISLSKIQSQLNLSRKAIIRYKKLWNISLESTSIGRPTIFDNGVKRLIKRKILSGELLTAKEVWYYLQNNGYTISYMSATRLLKGLEFFSRIKKKEAFSNTNTKSGSL
jgi:transposase